MTTDIDGTLCVASTGPSNLEKYRLVVALQVDIETIDRAAVARLAPLDQRGAAVGWHQRQHGVAGVGRLSVEINPRIIMQQHAAREKRQQNMRRLRLAVGVGDLPRLDGVERIIAVRISAAAAEPPELRI